MKIALVTGGSRGIGRAIALKLSSMGYYVLINYLHHQQSADETLQLIREKGGDGELLPFDVSDASSTQAALNSWQEAHPDEYIEVLVNNAGIRKDNLLVWMEQADFDDVLRTNLSSFFHVTKLLITPMIHHKYGRIVNIASLTGVKGMAGQCNYAAAKGGLIAATKSLALEVAKKHITVNAVAPGFVRTDMVEGLDENELRKQIPVNRFAEPEEVAALVGFLASAEASYITGECININGGLYS